MKTKKLLSVILCLVITISSLSFATVSASAAITLSEPNEINGVYQISTKEELYWFADKVNNNNANYGSANAVLTADIVVNTGVLDSNGELNTGTFTDWTPIGWYDYNNYVDYSYTGIFDGQGHTISGLYFNDTSVNLVGLFGWLGSGCEIKNVGVIDSYFRGMNGVGGVCGRNYYGTITGCYNTGTVSGNEIVGGVCGENCGGTIIGSYNTGTVSGRDMQVCGVCGYSFGTITGSYNAGTVSGDERVGGVCGFNYGGTIIGSYNTGEVTDDYSSDYSGTTLDIFVGGVCGVNNNGTITGCYNTGEVTGKVSGTVTGTVNIYDGGVCGYNTNRGTITGCYTNNGGVFGKNNNGTVTDCEEYTGDEFKDGTVCDLLNKAIGSSYDVTFYQGEEIPLFFSKTENRYCTVNYAVDPTYTVTIPQTVTLGQTATIKADDVLLDEDKQLEVYLTGTSETDNAFKVKSAEGAELEYTVNDGTKDISIDETVLTVNPDNSANGSATLKFNAPSDSDIIYAGKYTGTVTFTVSVADTQNS